MAQILRQKTISAEELLQLHIEQILDVNSVTNALVAERFELAREEARAIDEHRAAGHDLPPLAGVPFIVNESCSLAGMPNSAGLVARRFELAEFDATAVSRLKKAGLIPVGVSNVSELSLPMDTENQVYGRTSNPYQADHVVGGSSGGTGVLVTTGSSPVGLASGLSGSVRIPAFYNGTYAHKPSRGLIPSSGQFPVAKAKGIPFVSTGSLVRHAEDLLPILSILAGPDGHDNASRSPGLLSSYKVEPAKVKVFTMQDFHTPFTSRPEPDVRSAVNRAESALRSAGCRIYPFRNWRFKYSFEIWSSVLRSENYQLAKPGHDLNSKRKYWLETLRGIWEFSGFKLPPSVLAMIDQIPALHVRRIEKMLQYRDELKQELDERLGPNGVLICPTCPVAAPQHSKRAASPLDFIYSGIFNALGMPATQVPMGVNRDGLPIGIQVVALEGNDRLTIRVAELLAEVVAKWTPPSIVRPPEQVALV